MNCPVASTFRRVSLRPVEENITIGGAPETIVKKECGARLAAPSSATVPTHAMGRGIRTDLSSRAVSASPRSAAENSVRAGSRGVVSLMAASMPEPSLPRPSLPKPELSNVV